jgi:S1-C subfamily serine protease
VDADAALRETLNTDGMSTHRHITRALLPLLVVVLVAVGALARIAFARGAAPIGTGVVVVNTRLSYSNSAAAGTGIVIGSSGDILTNNHVISGATKISVTVPGTGHTYSAKVVGYNVTGDVAVLKLSNASNLKTASTRSAAASIGMTVTAIGNAGGTGSLTHAVGTVTATGQTITASDESGSSETLTGLIETDANVQPGDSGGPLVDSSGNVVGMTTAASAGGGFSFADSSSTGYAIPIAKALRIAGAITSGKASSTVHIGPTAFLGISVSSSDDSGYGYGSYDTPGAVIAGVVSGGPAAGAGLQAGDVILSIAGRSVSSPNAVRSIVLTKKPGQKVTVRYADETGTYTTTVTLGSGPAQ